MKKGNYGKKAVAFSTAVAMLATSGLSFPVVSAAQKDKGLQVKLEKLDSTYGKSAFDKAREKIAVKNPVQYKEDQVVDIIVELKEDSLLENYTRSTAGVPVSKAPTFQQYIATSKAKSASLNIEKEQNSTLSNIEKAVDDAQGIEVLYQYSTVMNGFAIRTKYGELENIKQLSNVKAAYVAPVFERPDPVYETNMSSSKGMIGTQNVWDLSYKGEGQVVAILDTGLDTKHEAFQKAPANPKFSKDDVQKIITDKMLNANVTKADSVYVNDKVPYVYDYADLDTVVDPTDESLTNGNSHGTHVAGTVAGVSDKIEGVAPEAQLMIFKVFPDATSGAMTTDIVAALEDCVRLGVDVVNMSLGSSNGFTDGSEEELSLGQVYERIMDAGISMSVSAGNSSTVTENNAMNSTALASNPDTAVVGSPSTYSSSTSVASVVNNILHAQYIGFGTDKLAFSESASGNQPTMASLKGQSFEYVVVPGKGQEADYEGLDVTGKVALVTRGGITFTEKVRTAANHGAVAAVICNNQPGTLSMAIEDEDYKIPAVLIGLEDGNKLKAAEIKKVDITDDVGEFDTNEGSLMSDFSSWGVSPNLDLKPEIAAPGGHIYSAVPFNTYSDMSGTSMAAPHVAGTYALVKEYIKAQDKFKDLTNEEVGKLATQLLMSTAHPTKNKDGAYYAPRQQGSGIVNIYDAVRTKAYLYTDNTVEVNGKPKLNLYDDPSKTGTFTKSFHIKNISDEAVTYQVVNASVAETVKEGLEGELVLGEKSKDVADQVNIEVSAENATCSEKQVTVEAGQDAKVTVKWTMTEELKKYFDENLVNGGFFEGFLQLENVVEADADLSIAYLGFYGDWTQAPLFDSGSVYDYKEFQQAPHAALSSDLYLGVNLFDGDTAELIYYEYSPYLYGDYFEKYALEPDENKIAISPNGDGVADSLKYMQLGMLRNARELTYTVKDKNGKVVKTGTSEYVGKSSYYKTSIYSEKLPVEFDGKDEEGNELPNNSTYTVEVKGKLDYTKHASKNLNDTVSLPVTIDTEAPAVENVTLTREDGKVYLSLNTSDNQYVSYVEVGILEDGQRKELSQNVVNEKDKNVVTDVKVDVTEQYEKYGKDADFYITAYDYAYNETSLHLFLVDNLEETPEPSVSPSVKPAPSETAAPSVEPVPSETAAPSVKPAAVTGLTAKAITTSSITLGWKKVSGVTGYEVSAYDQAKKAYVKVAECSASTTSVKVTAISKKKLTAGTAYSFKVNAYKTVKGKKTAGAAAALKTATRPVAPVLTVKAGTKKAVLSWKKVSGADGYVVCYSTKKTSGFVKEATVTGKTTFTKTGLQSKKTYYFKVKAFKTVNGKKIYSSASVIKSAKIK